MRFMAERNIIGFGLPTTYGSLPVAFVMSAANDPVADFGVRNLAFQVRYRYELAPLSYLYVVYGRGGFDRTAIADGVGEALLDSFDLRDDEQLMVKLSYRFEL